MTTLDIIQSFITCLSPIIIAIIGYMQVKRDKDDKKYRELRERYDRENEARAKAEKEENEKTLQEIKESISAMSNEIAEIKELGDTTELEKELQKLVTMSELNIEYCQSLSGVVTAIATTIKHTDVMEHDDIDKALQKHQDTEHRITQTLCKALY